MSNEPEVKQTRTNELSEWATATILNQHTHTHTHQMMKTQQKFQCVCNLFLESYHVRVNGLFSIIWSSSPLIAVCYVVVCADRSRNRARTYTSTHTHTNTLTLKRTRANINTDCALDSMIFVSFTRSSLPACLHMQVA